MGRDDDYKKLHEIMRPFGLTPTSNDLGVYNAERVRNYLYKKPAATQKEIAAALDIERRAVGRAIKKIRERY